MKAVMLLECMDSMASSIDFFLLIKQAAYLLILCRRVFGEISEFESLGMVLHCL